MLNRTQTNISKNDQLTPVILWGVSLSPYVRKIMVALDEKGITYEHREILPKSLLQATGQAVPVDFNEASPLGKIPALQVGNFFTADSAVIAHYLDRKFHSGNKLYPANPEHYARALWFEHYSDTVLTETIYKKLFLETVVKPNVLNIQPNIDLLEEAKVNELPALLDYLENAVTHFTWIAGDDFSMADIAISTQLIALQMSGFEIATSRWKFLRKYLENVTARPSFKKIL